MAIEDLKQQFAFVGGGSMGPIQIIYLANVAREKGADLSGTVFNCFDPKGFANGGIAYGDCDPNHKLNSVRTEMSPWDLEAFDRYCHEVLDCTENTALIFNPRADYKGFLEQEYQKACTEIARRGGQVIEREFAVDIEQSQNRDGHVTISQTETKDAPLEVLPSNVTLTVGYGPNNNFKELAEKFPDNYTHNLYSESANKIPTHDGVRILIVGSGPGLFDFANAYQGNKAQTNLIIVSREGHGKLGIRDVSKEVNEVHFKPSYIQGIHEKSTKEELYTAIKQDIAYGQKEGFVDRRIALDIIKALDPILSRMQTDEANKYIQSKEFKILQHMATPVPEESHTILDVFGKHHTSGRFDPKKVTKAPDNRLHIVLGNNTDVFDVDHIINATGHGRTNSPILVSLVEQDLARIDEGTNTMVTLPDGYTLIGSGGIACIGPATTMGLDGIETFSIKAEKRAEELIERIMRSREELGLTKEVAPNELKRA